MEKYRKNFCHFPVWKSLEKFLFCCYGKRKFFSRLDLLTYIFIIFYSTLIQFYSYCLYLVWVDHTEMLGLEKVRKMSGKSLEKVWKFIFEIA